VRRRPRRVRLHRGIARTARGRERERARLGDRGEQREAAFAAETVMLSIE